MIWRQYAGLARWTYTRQVPRRQRSMGLLGSDVFDFASKAAQKVPIMQRLFCPSWSPR